MVPPTANRTVINFEPGKFLTKSSYLKNYWKQGEFYFMNDKRQATITDVKFINPDLILVAHRDAAKLYLLKLTDSGCEILDTITLLVSKLPGKSRFYHPDLMAKSGNKFYLTEYTNRCAVYRVENEKIVFDSLFKVGTADYHGCYVDENVLLLGSASGGVVEVIEHSTGNRTQLRFDSTVAPINEEVVRIKAISTHGEDLILGLDTCYGSKTAPNEGGTSFIGLFKRQGNRLECLSALQFKNTQLDGLASANGYYFGTLHDGQKSKGVVYVLEVKNDELIVAHKTYCKPFPHGIDIMDGRVAITHYQDRCVEIVDLDYLLEAVQL